MIVESLELYTAYQRNLHMLQYKIVGHIFRTFGGKENYGAFAIPVLMIGTKLDQISEEKRREVASRSAMVADDLGCSEIYLVWAQLYMLRLILSISLSQF